MYRKYMDKNGMWSTFLWLKNVMEIVFILFKNGIDSSFYYSHSKNSIKLITEIPWCVFPLKYKTPKSLKYNYNFC